MKMNGLFDLYEKECIPQLQPRSQRDYRGIMIILRGMGWQTAYAALELLRANGSFAAPGFSQPEGVIAFHTQGNLMMKMTLLKDEEYKGKASQSQRGAK